MARGRDRDDLSVVASSAQPGARRFPENAAPFVANGRNNLTALSLELDLYFVASLHEILVFRPSFPTQTLSSLLYYWKLPESAPGLRGYLDQINHHAVNSILVDKLGSEEVLVCACDDGDVLIYYTKPLGDILAAPSGTGNHDGWFKPLAIQNVGKSAWGLAVHRNARLLGVSCNTHDITVFAFALTDDSVLYGDPETEWQYPGRSKDTSLTLKAHQTNIPNIAFFNSDMDKEGRYLVSTDLTGLTIIWDLRERNKLKQILPRATSISPNPHSGWSVACLDPRWFLLTKNDTEFLGCKLEQDAHGTYDVTQARLRVKDSSTSFQATSHASPATAIHGVLDRIRQHVAEIRGDMMNILEAQSEENGVQHFEQEEPGTAPNAAEVDLPRLDTLGDTDVDEVEDINEEDAEMQDMDLDMDPTLWFEYDNPPLMPLSDNQALNGFGWASNVIVREPSDEETTTDSSELDMSDRSASRPEGSLTISSSLNGPLTPSSASDIDRSDHATGGASRQSVITKSLASVESSNAPFLLLHAGVDFVSLQKAPFKDLAVLSRDPCYQTLSPVMARLLHYDRLNLIRVIPELNIVVIATPTGRAAIYTMTRRITKGRSRQRIQDEHCLRLDCILPFASQERRGKRPRKFLLGIATAPIQGHELAGQRWRLLLTYSDHTVLSYELWRGNKSAASFI